MSTEHSTSAPILKLPQEIYHLVAAHLPLQSRPSTLSALGLTATQIYDLVKPLLYAKVITKIEEHSNAVLRKLLKDEQLGLLIRELHIMTDLSVVSSTGRFRAGTTVFSDLHEVVKAGKLSHMNTLRLVLLPPPPWHSAQHWQRVKDGGAYDPLPRTFWKDLMHNCPHLRALFLEGIGDTHSDPWMDAAGLDELQELSDLNAFGLDFRPQFPRHDGSADRLIKSLPNLTSSLHTLILCFGQTQYPTPVLSLTFPRLKSLELSYFPNYQTQHTMNFWSRHPGLERVVVDEPFGAQRWFSDNIQPGLLPNLTHFKAHYDDVRAMASHLPQLQFLSIGYSIKGQIPYLLRSVLPNGLPDLTSLEIAYVNHDAHGIEGATWYETEDGEFHEETATLQASRTIVGGYMHSVVRGAPNLEELCLQTYPLYGEDVQQLAPILAHLLRLKRLYYRAFGTARREIKRSDIDIFIDDCAPLAEVCTSLTSVTDISLVNLPYLKAKIVRDNQGSVTEIISGYGFGPEQQGDDSDPFPKASRAT